MEGLLEVLTQAVDARLRTPPGSVGSMMSGGMDSGSITAIAKNILRERGIDPLRTFSAAQRNSAAANACAETQAIDAAAKMTAIHPTLIYPDMLSELSGDLSAVPEEPFDCNFVILKAIFLAAHRQGLRVVLNGGGGDVVLRAGSHVIRLIRSGHFRIALREMHGERKFWQSGSLTPILMRYTRAALIPEAIKPMLRRLVRRDTVAESLKSSLISRDLAKRVDIRERLERMRRRFPSGWQSDYAIECCDAIRPNVTAGVERYGRIAAATGTETSDPFLDKRVVDFCSRIPGRLRQQDGWHKMILRRVMSGRLPDEVLWCRGKPHLGWLYNETITRQAMDRGDLNLTRLETALAGYVDSSALARQWQAFRARGDAERVHTAYFLAKWLQAAAQRPVVLSKSIR
jgi:asparagine synthase (glutamine-hydrolysing)